MAWPRAPGRTWDRGAVRSRDSGARARWDSDARQGAVSPAGPGRARSARLGSERLGSARLSRGTRTATRAGPQRGLHPAPHARAAATRTPPYSRDPPRRPGARGPRSPAPRRGHSPPEPLGKGHRGHGVAPRAPSPPGLARRRRGAGRAAALPLASRRVPCRSCRRASPSSHCIIFCFSEGRAGGLGRAVCNFSPLFLVRHPPPQVSNPPPKKNVEKGEELGEGKVRKGQGER